MKGLLRTRKRQHVRIDVREFWVMHVDAEPRWPEHVDPGTPAYIIQWEKANIVIPWPYGKTPKEAIIEWAKRQ